jgi:hypothetical protein
VNVGWTEISFREIGRSLRYPPFAKDAKDEAPLFCLFHRSKAWPPPTCKPLFLKQIADARHSPKKLQEKDLQLVL